MSKETKKTLGAQLKKLETRAEGDIELLFELRSFVKEKAKIEEEYGKALEKLARTFLAKRLKKGPPLHRDVGSDNASIVTTKKPIGKKASAPGSPYFSTDAGPVRPMYNAFLNLIMETERIGRNALGASERLILEITDVLKESHRLKTAVSKKSIEFGQKYHQDSLLSFEELDRTKTLYEKAAREADSAKKKFDDTSKNPNSGLNALKNMMSRTDGDERIEKLRVKWTTATQQLTAARNDYILALESVNAIQERYFTADIAKLIKKVDGDYHETLHKAFATYADVEETKANALNETTEVLTQTAGTLNRAQDLEQFLADNVVTFGTPGRIPFEQAGQDDTNILVVDEDSKIVLGNRLYRLLRHDEELSVSLEKKMKEMHAVKQLADTYKDTPQFGNANSPLEQVADFENSIDLLEAVRNRVIVQIQMLKDANVEPIAPIAASTTSIPISSPSLSRSTSAEGSATLRPSFGTYTAEYSYAASADGELSLEVGDEVEAIEVEKGGWIKVRSANGEEGYVPFDYIAKKTSKPPIAAVLPPRPSAVSSSSTRDVTALYEYKASDKGELSFRVGDVIEVIESGEASDDAWWEGRNRRTGDTGSFPLVFVEGWRPSESSRGSLSIAAAQAKSIKASTAKDGRETVRALYKYDATCDGELSMSIGDIITVTNKNTGDDMWWEGEGPSGKGQFPVNHVETVSDYSGKAEAVTNARSVRLGGSSVSSSTTSLGGGGFSVKAIYDYKGTDSSELTFKTGDYIKITESSDPDWWTGTFRGKSGLLPASYVSRV
ncbi:hypothetical protein DFJ73DRAFT_872570 [Zopfochytrium polystomum]|nr:hypothetical protein DFJ73DRAFT_872570 [Zopfochytrium polystomum]